MAARVRAPRQRADQLGAVDRLDDVGVGRDRRGLVGLEPADEVPPQAEVGALGGLHLRLLVAVLPHVGDAEVGEQPDVGGGEELGDDDERHVVLGPPGASAHAAAMRRRTTSRLAASTSARAVIGWLQMTPANRVAAAPSRR